MDAVIALPLVFPSLAVTEGNNRGPGEESDPEFPVEFSHDAQDKNKINTKIAVFPKLSRIK
jgi:hypothetical protein